jgi:hypothetical protein
MVFDLNSKPPDQGEAFTDMDEEPPDEQPFPFDEALPDLNEWPSEEELVGGTARVQNEGISSGKFFGHLCQVYKNAIVYTHLCLPHCRAC